MYKKYLFIIFAVFNANIFTFTRIPYKTSFPLHYAALMGNHHQIKRLVNDGDHLIDAPDLWGNSPIHLAAAADRQSSVEYLLTLGAESEVVNHYGFRPEDVAINDTRRILREYQALDLPKN
jgi:ankyrin repeat protein